MTEDELSELVDMYVAGELAEALRARVEEHLAAHPNAARDAETLRATLTRLEASPSERPDSWFTERLLDTLLREHATAQSSVAHQ